MCYVSQFNILFKPSFLLLLFVLLSLLLMLVLLPSSVLVGNFITSWTEDSSVITVSPTHPTSHPHAHPVMYICAISRPPGKLKLSMEILFNQTSSTSELASHQLVSRKSCGWLWYFYLSHFESDFYNVKNRIGLLNSYNLSINLATSLFPRYSVAS